MDIELLFSRQPFVQSQAERFSFITPTSTLAIALPEGRNLHHVDLPAAFECEQRCPHRNAPHVVPGSVDRIDDPADRAAAVSELLAEHLLAGTIPFDERANPLLGIAVGLRDGREVGLRVDP